MPRSPKQGSLIDDVDAALHGGTRGRNTLIERGGGGNGFNCQAFGSKPFQICRFVLKALLLQKFSLRIVLLGCLRAALRRLQVKKGRVPATEEGDQITS
ncbi:MAG: hypothetical protein M5U16_01360 [Hyphomicrobium sp.]|nr:hypothetical protein [Hyphomicrobium sp.]